MEIRKTVREDLPRVMEIYEIARSFMRSHGNLHQWINGYPSRELIEEDIRQGGSYVCLEGGRIVGTFFYMEGEEPTYRVLDGGAWLNDQPYGVVHRLASDGSIPGVGTFCLAWSLERCGNLRIDTHRDNQVMQNLLKKLGFSYCGIVYMGDGSERVAFQKKL